MLDKTVQLLSSRAGGERDGRLLRGHAHRATGLLPHCLHAADVLHGLLESSVSGVVEQSDDAFAAIKSFQSSFRQISRTPEMIRLVLQAEFNFAGVVDASAMGEAEAARAANRVGLYNTGVGLDRSRRA